MATHSDRGAWWATIHTVAESDTTEVTSHTHVLYDIRICKSITGNLKEENEETIFLCRIYFLATQTHNQF